jgi:hypothetical protein
MDYSLLIGLHTLTEMDEVSDETNDEGDDYTFYRDFKGFQSSFEDGSRGPEVYYLGKHMAFCFCASFVIKL